MNAIAKAISNEWDIDDIPLGYEFLIKEARQWSLYISEGIKNEPTHSIEPRLFLITPNQTLY
ncbi:hypothetical protein [Psychroserpens burtonensis]|uniref:hypothetical protein n=1 Tax=Psychroserpens burtonensis TaxID=49278 RepID=UPI00041F4651|nr:hypothetical protein [Psychroserpens burtonensis]